MKKTILTTLVAASVIAVSGNAGAAALALSDNLQVHIVTGQTATAVTALAIAGGTIETRAQNTINVVDADTVAVSLGIAGVALARNRQFSFLAGQDANAVTVGTLSGAGTDTVAVNVINQQNANTVGLGLGLGLAVGTSQQTSVLAFQDAYAVTALSASGGDINTVAGNSVNANSHPVVGAGVIAGVGLNNSEQRSFLAVQDSDANSFLVASIGGSVSTVALNNVNTANLNTVGAGVLFGGAGSRNLQLSALSFQSANANSIGVLAFGGDVTTVAGNTVNSASVNTLAVGSILAVAGTSNTQVSGLALQQAQGVTVGAIATGNISTSAVNSVNSAELNTFAIDPI